MDWFEVIIIHGLTLLRVLIVVALLIAWVKRPALAKFLSMLQFRFLPKKPDKS